MSERKGYVFGYELPNLNYAGAMDSIEVEIIGETTTQYIVKPIVPFPFNTKNNDITEFVDKDCVELKKQEITNMSEDAIKISKEDISNEEIGEVLEDVTLMVMRKSSDKKNFHILKMLPSSKSDIAEKLEMSENVTNRRIKGLTSSGLVSEEAESALVNITELGEQMLNLIDYIKGRTKDEVMKMIDEGGLERK